MDSIEAILEKLEAILKKAEAEFQALLRDKPNLSEEVLTARLSELLDALSNETMTANLDLSIHRQEFAELQRLEKKFRGDRTPFA